MQSNWRDLWWVATAALAAFAGAWAVRSGYPILSWALFSSGALLFLWYLLSGVMESQIRLAKSVALLLRRFSVLVEKQRGVQYEYFMALKDWQCAVAWYKAAISSTTKVDPHYGIRGRLTAAFTVGSAGSVVRASERAMGQLQEWFTWWRRLLCWIPLASNPDPPLEPPDTWHKPE